MKVLYVNNFRGFKKTFLNLKNVNFFVGENSTGKTSLLKLIRILSNDIFFKTTEFNLNTDQGELGYFSEIVNNDANFFEIGISNGLGKLDQVWYKLTYKEKDGFPAIHKILFVNSFIHLELTIDSGNKYYYKIFESEDRPLIFANWINKNGLPKKDLKVGALEKIKGYNYPVFLLFNQALTDIEKNNKVSDGFYPRTILSRVFKNEAVWLAPIRTEPQRTYADFKTTFNPNGSHSPYVLKKIILNDSHESVRNGINKFGQESGLFEKLEILSYDNSDTSPFEVRICINGNSLKITNVGYGISQILPIVTEIIARPQHTWFAIQQPEIHLHPKAQAAFGEFIFSSLPDHKNFIIETHSDYLIDRFRLCTNRANNVKGESQIVFFQRTDKGNNITIIPINQDGSYPDDQPIEFREFFIKEQIDLLSI